MTFKVTLLMTSFIEPPPPKASSATQLESEHPSMSMLGAISGSHPNPNGE